MSKKTNLDLDALVGKSPAFRNVVEIAEKMVSHPVPLLIEGEKGTGKTSLARAIHYSGPRQNGEFIIFDCEIEQEAILESELFGYVRGSFAGAIHSKKGLLELADGGTIFFKHISKLKPSIQAKIASFLSEGGFYKLGGVSKINPNVRIIASSEENLTELILDGKFKEDLFYRLSAIRILLPPLRERGGDTLLLADYFLDNLSKQASTPEKHLTEQAKRHLLHYDWPDNVKELEQEIKRAFFKESTQQIGFETFSHLNPSRKKTPSNSLKEQKKKLIETLERNAIAEALRKTAGNRTQAADLLAISRQDLIRKIAFHKIKI